MTASADFVFRNGTIVDGTGSKGYSADIAITGDRITGMGQGLEGREIIDVTGSVICPGFIDVHTHDDRLLLSAPDMTPKISQGVTTVVTGNCGVSLAPLTINRRPPPPLDLLGSEEWYRFSDFGAFVEAIEASEPAVNAAPMVGHSTLRVGVMDDVKRPATEAEIVEMKRLLVKSLDAGAIGFSTGLYYPTNNAAPTDEVVALAEALAPYEAVYTTHMRDEGRQIMTSLEETFETGRRAGVRTIISHHKCAHPTVWGKSVETLALIDKAMESQEVGLDVYPYVAGSTVLLPHRVPDARRIMISWSVPHPEVQGRDLKDIAAEWGIPEIEAAEKLLPAGAIYFLMDEADVRRILAHPKSMIGSDGLPHDTHPHPRLWGTFPRVLGHYCREEKLFSLELAVHKMTGLSAERFRLKDRGVLKTGAYADIVVFNPETVIDRSTFETPLTPSDGIDHVLVNGTMVWSQGKATKSRPGRVIKNAKAA